MSVVECDICHSEFPEIDCINLGCCHSYCIDCTIYYVKLGGPTRKLTFNHLYCPYRCGNSFQSCVQALRHRELGSLINDQVALMNKVNAAAADMATKLAIEGSFEEAVQHALEKFSFYLCDTCEIVFGEEDTCCAASDEKEKEYLCGKCQNANQRGHGRKRLVSPAVALWREARKERGIIFDQMAALTTTEVILCNSDYNAAEQQTELEVMMSMYPDDIEVITPPPGRAGQPCSVYSFKLPTTQHVAPEQLAASPAMGKFILRCMDQIRIIFKATEGYPSLTPPQLFLQIGDLSMLEFNSTLKRRLSTALQQVISQNSSLPCAYVCFVAVIDWMDSLREYESERLAEEMRMQEVAKRKKQLENEKSNWRYTRDFCKKNHCIQCPRCSFGPVFHDICLDLTEYHSLVLRGRFRIDNSCPNCGWFAIYWNHWLPWDGKFMFEREQLLAGKDESKTLSKAALAKQERQNLNCLVASLRAHAKQCGQCGYGPVLHQYCDLLYSHHGDRVNGGTINNSCPSCGWFAQTWSAWKPWSGKIGKVKAEPSKPSKDCTGDGGATDESNASVVESEANQNLSASTAVMGGAADNIVESLDSSGCGLSEIEPKVSAAVDLNSSDYSECILIREEVDILSGPIDSDDVVSFGTYADDSPLEC